MRVISLVPSVTETLLAWGVDVIACTRFCEQPGLRHVGGTKDPDIAAIVGLRPDLVVVDREENRRDDADALTGAAVPLHVTHVASLADVGPMLTALAAAVGAQAPDEPTWQREPVWATAFVPIWKRPWMTVNRHTYGSSVLAAIGVKNVFDDHAATYPTVEPAEVSARRPSMVLLPSEPYPFAQRHVRQMAEAFPDSVPVLVDGQDLFWWGVRSEGAVGRLRAALHRALAPS
ncbi:MAG: helical backbone metal receptor [Ilumatobacteraceae bacterium]